MTTKVNLISHSGSATPVFPQSCVLCCEPANAHIALSLESLYQVGDYRTDLSDSFGLAYAGGTNRVKGFSIKTEGSSRNAMESRKVYTSVKCTGRVPYCDAHMEQSDDAERESEMRALACGLAGFVLGIAVLAWNLLFEDFENFSGALLPAVAAGFAGAGIWWLGQFLSMKMKPSDQQEYLKGSTLRGSQGNLGWRCTSKWPKRMDIRNFLSDPHLTLEFEFVNDDYARQFASKNNAEILGD